MVWFSIFKSNNPIFHNVFNNRVKVIHVKIIYSFAAKSLVISPSGNPPLEIKGFFLFLMASLFAQEIPKQLILLCMDVAVRLENTESQKQ